MEFASREGIVCGSSEGHGSRAVSTFFFLVWCHCVMMHNDNYDTARSELNPLQNTFKAIEVDLIHVGAPPALGSDGNFDVQIPFYDLR